MKSLLFFTLVTKIVFLFGKGDCDDFLIEWSKKSNLSFNQRLASLQVVINEANEQKEYKCLANSLRRLGTLYKSIGKFDLALVNYVCAAKFSEKIKDSTSHASSLNQIGLVYLELKNYSFALTYFERARVLYIGASFFRGAADAGLNMAEIHLELGNIEDAERINLKSMESRRLFGDTSEMGYNYDLLSRLNLKKGIPKQALYYSRIANELFHKSDDASGLLPSYIQQGFCFENLNQVDSALYYYKESFLYAKKYQYKKYIAEAANNLANAFEKLNRSDSAIVYLKLYTVYNDSLLNETIADATADAAAKYETEKKDIELENTIQLSKQMTQQLYILVGLVIVLVLSILLIVRNFRQRKKIQEKESALNSANAMIEGQDVERERIARELHDRVGSMLSTVKLQVSTMDDQMGTLIKQHGESYKKVIHLLDDTYDEVRRISHDLDSGLLSRFGFKTAMLQLVQLLESTNKLKVMYIDNGIEPTIYKPYETDLYRITQELLSNAIKYASAKEISIQLTLNNGNLVYSYEDDGVGFEKEKLETNKGIGYQNIETRVKKMKGTLHLDTSPDHGTNVIIEIPLHAKS